ncbi:KH domain-containing protein [Bdellovibrio sp. HCB288]|uniref:KH domain-containing protein n=1 Tax=Bdellovibrio sp. HCB288 TaxID=3394355 RepID=UPI0039B626A3
MPIVIRKSNQDVGRESNVVDLNFTPNKSEVLEATRKKLEEILVLIVDHPGEVSVNIVQGERTTIFKIECSRRNFGRILGSRGKMIAGLRTISLALTARHGIRSIVEVPYFAAEAG